MRNNDVKSRFGSSVRFWRNQLGISQEDLAERADVHRTYICDVERGSRNVSLEIIEKLAQALEVSTATLFQSHRASEEEADNPVSGLTPKELVKILFVEDNGDDAAMTLWALKRTNLANDIQLVRDGAAALDFLFCTGQFAHRRPGDLPQLILLDLNLPKVSGLEVLRRIKAHPQTRAIPVVVLTMSSRSQDVTESQRLGAKAYIVKPVDLHNFGKVVPKLNLHWAVVKPAGGVA
ncbi:MAG TPA: response regulator [Verrucomicrobiae bacterium]|nr:response regulator [Verrucomicrobiae bacterium]